jgi:hypothetical protein
MGPLEDLSNVSSSNRANIRRGLGAIAAIACYGAAVYFRMTFSGPYPYIQGLMEPYGPETGARLATLTCALAFFIPLHFVIARLCRDLPGEPEPAAPIIPSRARDPLMYLATTTMSSDSNKPASTPRSRR